ncbi:transposase family protein [Pseudofrankia sp. BMG5.36]|uniref:transposase family protein n=1 Tax=Pseudofrankia sp. BMG5.36 TaxID=1834512 RepID=UPI0008DB1638|nr:transposase family protein [Pseudofrankia sp. BMG5.36]OHV52672.1 transposase [Pseudofrankia sp. BMG5.36]
MTLAYVGKLQFSEHTVLRLAVLLVTERGRRGTRKGTRALTPWAQAVLVLRWLRDGVRVGDLCDDNDISSSAGYRYLHEGIAVLAWQAPGLRNALTAASLAGYDHVIVDGTVIETDRVRVPGPTRGVDLWWSAKIHNHGGNIQVVSAPDDGWPLWVSDVRPGREHDTTALRASGALPALAEWTDADGGILTDLGYEGLRDQVQVPHKRAQGAGLPLDQQKHNRVHNALRAVGERANALLKYFKALRNVSLDPWKIGLIVKAALVILHTEHRRTT